MNSAFYHGTISHCRHIPKQHGFSYPFFMWFLNLDKLDVLPSLGRWFSLHRWAVNRFRREDYFGKPSESLADSIRRRMQELTGRDVTGEVCGLVNLRTLGLYFSPVNFYYGFDTDGTLTHFLAEVSNIPWNERHHYAHFVGDQEFSPVQQKEFKVSPFNPVDQMYRWIIGVPGQSISVGLQVSDKRGHIFDAHLQLNRQPLVLKSIRRYLLRKPVMTCFIVAGIYWQALKIYLKGIPYVPYQKEMT